MIRYLVSFGLALATLAAAEPDFPLTADSQPQPNVPKGELIEGSYTAHSDSVFPGTVRDYQIYLPAGLDKSKPAAFMVFQDGVIYQAPVVFDNLIAKKDIPPLVGIFIKPGVVPAANENALPRFNRSYEYDSITPTYSEFLIDEFLPAIESKHSLKLSTDPNQAAISGNSSGGICAFMVAWHRPDRFRRVFTGVGTYVGIHGADQLPVLVRKFEPKPLRIFLQSGTGDNNLYCGDWWMANQMMERSLTWAGYDVNHAWGEGGHNAKHASQIFPEVLRWLWRDWPTTMEIKANPKGDSNWKGYEVVGDVAWSIHFKPPEGYSIIRDDLEPSSDGSLYLAAWHQVDGEQSKPLLLQLGINGVPKWIDMHGHRIAGIAAAPGNQLRVAVWEHKTEGTTPIVLIKTLSPEGALIGKATAITKGTDNDYPSPKSPCCDHNGRIYFGDQSENMIFWVDADGTYGDIRNDFTNDNGIVSRMCFSPDQTQLYVSGGYDDARLNVFQVAGDGKILRHPQAFHLLQTAHSVERFYSAGFCVDTNGWLYVATSLGIQVLDQAGRVNFILPTPKPALDVCFGGKDLSELFIACGDTIYKRPTKVKGVVSGQQAPIKPAPPKL